MGHPKKVASFSNYSIFRGGGKTFVSGRVLNRLAFFGPGASHAAAHSSTPGRRMATVKVGWFEHIIIHLCLKMICFFSNLAIMPLLWILHRMPDQHMSICTKSSWWKFSLKNLLLFFHHVTSLETSCKKHKVVNPQQLWFLSRIYHPWTSVRHENSQLVVVLRTVDSRRIDIGWI